ncbi:TetR/AcrR family transcriptional regulator [Streptomyces sp. NPDC003077]|uniref:TetR/AcrR family transcriptional regulator n=1 Tax=Streptomyces sp. NPDC003077 TaxID=3154443 RepID=UPI0033A74A41
MPTARESLLNAAYAALVDRPWAGVRMVDVAAAAGVSRQTLYNEFGSKEGLARALVRRETESYLAGVDRALAGDRAAGVPPAEAEEDAETRVVAAATWTLRAARANPLVRAALTGCWGERLPVPPMGRQVHGALRRQAGAGGPTAVHGGPEAAEPPAGRGGGLPAQRAAFDDEGLGDVPLPGPTELVGRFCDRAVAALEADWPKEELPELGTACATAARLTLSYVVAPAEPEEVTRLVRDAFARLPRRGEGRPV